MARYVGLPQRVRVLDGQEMGVRGRSQDKIWTCPEKNGTCPETVEFSPDSKLGALKVLEEASEAVEAWKRLDMSRRDYESISDIAQRIEWQTRSREALADELADVVQAVCDLAYGCGVDMVEAMKRCEARNRARGRICDE